MKYVYLVYHYDDGWHWKISRNHDNGVTVAHSPDRRPCKTKSAAMSALRSFTDKVARDWDEPSGISGFGRGVNIEVRQGD